MDTLQKIGVFLVDTLFSLYIGAVVIRFVLALSRADFHNPFSQMIVKVTNPTLLPLRRFIPSLGKIDTSAIVLAISLIIIKMFLILAMRGAGIDFVSLFIFAVIELLRTIIWIYIIALIIQMVLSWVGNSQGNPLTPILYSLIDPILRPIRNVVPMIGMIDFSPMVAVLGLNILRIIVNGFGF